MAETKTFGRRRSLPEAQEQAFDKGASEATATAAPAAAGDSAGWAAADRVSAALGGDLYLKVEEKDTVVKILDSEPFDNYVAHWVEEVSEGSKSVRCWGTAECPLCRIGDKPRKFAACFNVVSLADPKLPVLRVWEAGVKISRQLKEIAHDPKKGPLDRDDLYFTIRKNQTKKAVEYVLERVRARDLEEETGVKPLSDDQLAKFTDDMFTEPVKELLDDEAMNEIVTLLLDD